MINHGSGILLCLKSVSNKLTSFASIAVKRRHVIQENGLSRHLSKSASLREFYNSSAHSAPSVTEATSCDLWSAGPLKTSAVQAVGVRFSSKPTSEAISQCHVGKQVLSKNCAQKQLADSQLGVPFAGTLDDIVLVNSSELCSKKSLLIHTSENPPLLYTDLERQMILLSHSDDGSMGLQVKKEFVSGNPSDSPTEEQIEKVRSTLASDLPQFFYRPLNYTIYHPSIEFENNIRGKNTKGIYDYVKQAAYFRTVGHLRFIYIKYEVLKITGHPEDGTVKVRWKINIIRFSRILKFWQLKIWDWSTIWDKVDVWYDGFSTYHIRGDGLVYKHVADKMMPDQDHLLVKKIEKAGTTTGTLYCARTSHPYYILYNPSKNFDRALGI